MSDSATPWTAGCQTSLSFTISRSLLKFLFIESVILSNHLILRLPLLLPSIFPIIRSFPVSQLFTSGGQSIGPSPSASVLPISIQGWFPLGVDWFVLLVVQETLRSVLQYCNWEHQFFDAHLYGPTLTSIQDYWKNHSFDYSDLCQQSDVAAFSERVKIGVR